MGLERFIGELAEQPQQADNSDYLDAEGLLMCGKCHTRKQCEIEIPGEDGTDIKRRVFCACKCRQAEIEAEHKAQERYEFQKRLEALRRDGITDKAYLRHTFENDDRRSASISDVCRRYADKWNEMKAENIGILFYGGVGTGKTFYACCIANELINKLVSVGITNLPRILNRLQNGYQEERQQLIDGLQRYSLLVIDDLGVERDSSYSVEQVYNVIDTRSRSGKPLIITTNLSLKEIQNAQSLAHQRIYDRVLELCPIRLALTGSSRRIENASARRDKAREILADGRVE